jgi:hypothetical protein
MKAVVYELSFFHAILPHRRFYHERKRKVPLAPVKKW